MSLLLWRFWTYSFLGYLLEKAFAAAVGSENQVRRCRLLLPLCPVYGLGALAVLALPERMTGTFAGLALWGGGAATAVEYAVHWWYDAVLGVRFWDYGDRRWNLRGRVCPVFSLAWGLLLASALPGLDRWLALYLPAIPLRVTWGMLLVSAADTVTSWHFLRRTRDTGFLSPPRRASRRSSTGGYPGTPPPGSPR